MHARTWAVVIGILGSWAVVLLHESLRVGAGEWLPLAWLRACAEHPIRIGAALTLLTWGAFPGAPAPEPANPQPATPGKLSGGELSCSDLPQVDLPSRQPFATALYDRDRSSDARRRRH